MESQTGTLTFVRSRGSPTRSGRRSSNFCDSLQQAVSRLTGSNFGFLLRKDYRLVKRSARRATDSHNRNVLQSATVIGVRI